jgi:hypothetical protein
LIQECVSPSHQVVLCVCVPACTLARAVSPLTWCVFYSVPYSHPQCPTPPPSLASISHRSLARCGSLARSSLPNSLTHSLLFVLALSIAYVLMSPSSPQGRPKARFIPGPDRFQQDTIVMQRNGDAHRKVLYMANSGSIYTTFDISIFM